MGKQNTGMKRAFLEAFRDNGGDVPKAAREAGYTAASSVYRYLKTDEQGAYLDPITRSILGGSAPVSPPKPRSNASLRVLVPGVDYQTTDELTVESVHAHLMRIATDPLMPAGPRVQALNVLLKDLREVEVPVEPSSEEIIAAVSEALRMKT